MGTRTARRAAAGLLTSSAVLAGATALAPAADAAGTPTVAVSQACYVNVGSSTAPITVTGSGWTPGDTVQLQSADDLLYDTVTVAADGTISAQIQGVEPDGTTPKSETLTATDQGNETTGTDPTDQTATSTAFDTVNLGVATAPAVSKPSKKVTFNFAGFAAGKEIYGHYVHKGKLKLTYKFGRASGACGLLKTKAHLYPGKAKYDSYSVQFDNSKKYSKKTLPAIVATLSFFKF
jgi:hypothetical protein